MVWVPRNEEISRNRFQGLLQTNPWNRVLGIVFRAPRNFSRTRFQGSEFFEIRILEVESLVLQGFDLKDSNVIVQSDGPRARASARAICAGEARNGGRPRLQPRSLASGAFADTGSRSTNERKNAITRI